MTNLQWIQRGNTGCTFATLFSKNPSRVGWRFFDPNQWDYQHNQKALPLVVTIEFPKDGYWSKETVRKWALEQGFYEELTSDSTLGLRIKCEQGVAWVQYFGPDSHVKTRQSPSPMLMYTNKLNTSHYIKVGWNGILHLAHAWTDSLNQKAADILWDRAHHQTKKIIGHDLTIEEAAKTSFKL